MLSAVILHTFLEILILVQDPRFTVVPGSDMVRAATTERVNLLVTQGLSRLEPSFPDTQLSGLTIHLHANLESVPVEVRRYLHEGTAGLALLEKNQIHLILEEARLQPPGDLRTVVDHELVHMLLHKHSGKSAIYVPRWFHEGLAQELSGATYLGVKEEDIAIPARMGNLLRFRDLRSDFPDDDYGLRLAYGQSFSYVAFLRRKLGLTTIIKAAGLATHDQWYRGGFFAVTGTGLFRQEARWRDYLENDSGALWRRMQTDCFYYLMIPGTILLVWAARRALSRDQRSKERLELAGNEDDQDFEA